MKRVLTAGTGLLFGLPLSALANDTICVDMTISGFHENVIVPPDVLCNASGAYISGNVQVFGAFQAYSETTIEGNVHGEPGHRFVRLFGTGVVVRGNVQLKNAASDEPSGYTAGTEIGGNFQWEENPNPLIAQGGTIGGDFVMTKSRGGGELFGNAIQGNLQCSENDPAPTGGGNTVGGNKEDQCATFGFVDA
jgi:hypothetical protein